MKNLIYISSLTIVLLSCKCPKKGIKSTKETNVIENGVKESSIPTILYEANARNFVLKLKVENQILYINKHRDIIGYESQIKISDNDWKEITDLVKKVDLNKVKDLKWPTEMRYYDGAADANVTFISNGIEYPAKGFDHGHPPLEIENLINKIVKLTEKP
ncbi:hypothetical protein [Flavobacterium sp.]|jgi:hypothetical protein|uniref:hypothetical protein n=1 Tax=Flavobacterium sp. TaxID=239 RepID=UPI0025BD46CC|nr:hypothetical protein [Flavobacterium sp.]